MRTMWLNLNFFDWFIIVASSKRQISRSSQIFEKKEFELEFRYCPLSLTGTLHLSFSWVHLAFAPGGYYCVNRLVPGAFTRAISVWQVSFGGGGSPIWGMQRLGLNLCLAPDYKMTLCQIWPGGKSYKYLTRILLFSDWCF